MANIKSLSDLKEEQMKKQKKEMTVSHYTGGQNSGLAVENGDQGDAHGVAIGKLPENCRKITLYKNGFTVDDGEFRDLSVAANKKFMDDIEAGFLPPELSAKGKYITVALSDKSHIPYEPPVVKEEKVAYYGAGHKLGGSSTAEVSTEELKKLESLPQQLIVENLDSSKPITNLQIRLYNGKRIEQKLNHDHTVEDLYASVHNITPVDFLLLHDFPLKVIPKSTMTLVEAKIVDAVITQKRI